MKSKTQITAMCSYIMHAWSCHVGQAPDEILRNCQFLVTFLSSTQLYRPCRTISPALKSVPETYIWKLIEKQQGVNYLEQDFVWSFPNYRLRHDILIVQHQNHTLNQGFTLHLDWAHTYTVTSYLNHFVKKIMQIPFVLEMWCFLLTKLPNCSRIEL